MRRVSFCKHIPGDMSGHGRAFVDMGKFRAYQLGSRRIATISAHQPAKQKITIQPKLLHDLTGRHVLDSLSTHLCVADLSVTPLTLPLLVCTTNSSLMAAFAAAAMITSSIGNNSQRFGGGGSGGANGDDGDGRRRSQRRLQVSQSWVLREYST